MEWQNTQDCEKSAHDTAKIICECVNNWLTNVDIIQKQLEDSNVTNETPQFQVVLQFLHHCIDVFPECYVQKHAVTKNDNEQGKREISQGFTTWVLGRLMNILGFQVCVPIHGKCLSVVTSILKLVQDRDLIFYKKLLTEIVYLYKDILTVCDHYQTSNNEAVLSSMSCNRFMDCQEKVCQLYSISPQVISLQTYEHCRNLLRNLSSVLQENLPFLQCCATDLSSQLSSMIVETASLGDEMLLQNMLNLMCGVIENMKPLQGHLTHQYINITVAILEWIVEEERDPELAVSLKKVMIALIEANLEEDSLCRRFLNKLAYLIQKNGNKTLENMLLIVVAKAVKQWPNLSFNFFSKDIVDLCIRRICGDSLDQEVHEAYIYLINHFTYSSHLSGTRCGEVMLLLKEKVDTIIHDIQHQQQTKKVDEKISLLRALNFLMQLTVEKFTAEEIQGFYGDVQLQEIYEHLVRKFKAMQKVGSTVQLHTMYMEVLLFLRNYNYVMSVCSVVKDSMVVQASIEICSIPWVATIDPPWFDLKIVFFNEKEIRALHSRLNNQLSSGQAQMRCLDLLLLLVQDVSCHTWITHIMRNTLAHPKSATQKKLLECLPEFVFLLNKYSQQSFHEDLFMFVRAAPPELVATAGGVIKQLVCVFTGSVTQEYESGKLKLKCVCCQPSGDNPPQKSENVADNVRCLKPYFQMLKQCANKSFKYHVTTALGSLVEHVQGEEDLSALWIPVLDLLQDADFETRFSLCDVLTQLLNNVEQHSYHQLTVDHISDSVFKANQLNDTSVLETVLLAMGSVGTIARDELLSAMLVSLFNCFVTLNQFLAALAADQIHGIARSKKISNHALFLDHKSSLCDITVKKLHKDLDDGKDFHNVTNTFFSIAKLFEFSDVKTFLLETATEILPKVVEKSSKNSSILLRLIAKYAQQNRREMLFYNFKYIFSYLLRTISNETDLERCLHYLQEETDVELSILLLSEYQSVLNQLILYLSMNREQVYQGFTILASNDDNYKGPKTLDTDSKVALFLQHKLLGILAFFNTILTSSPKYIKKIALKSMLGLLGIMGKTFLTPVRLKVMAILKLALKYNKEYLELCCEAWYRFVQNIELESLGPLLGQIVATLLPLLESVPDLVAVIFNFLIVDNREALKEYFKDVYFVPSHPMLKKAKAIIEGNLTPVTNLQEFKKQLQSACKSVASENEEVRKFALIKICQLLESNVVFLRDSLVKVDFTDASIKHLIHTLMQVTKESGSEVYSLVGRCFGILGAMDISGVVDGVFDTSERTTEQEKNNGKLLSIFDANEFAVDVINELCRSFLAASNTRAQDCAAYSIQETLRFYACSSKPSDSGYQLWSKFPEATQEVLSPHLRSKYVNTSVYNWSKQQLPLYGSAKGATYRDWTCNYTSYLIHHLSETDLTKLVKPFLSVIKHDLRMALYLLPQVVLVTLSTSANNAIIHTEFATIFNLAAASDAVNESLSLCIQTLFSVLDFLTTWYRLRGNDAGSSTVTATKSSVKNFLNSIQKDVLATASLHGKSLARSLMYYEEHIATSGESVEEHLQFLQKIYYALDEPDGIAGIAATRKAIATLNEKIVEHESSGNLRGAVACFERAIVTNPDEVAHHKGLLNCLIGLGQLNNASMNVAGIIENRPDWEEQLQPYQAEVSWRLGQWDHLRNVVKTCEKPKANWSIALGKLLLSLKFKEASEFKQLLSVVRSEQSQILLNSSLGSRGYGQAYQSLLRLHMLEDMEVCSSFVFNNQLHQDDASRIIGNWNKRMEIIESSYKTRESVLYLHQILLQMLPDHQQTPEIFQKESQLTWLKMAKISRKNGLFQTAYSALLNIDHINQGDVLVEKANWYSSQKNLHEALQSLEEHSPTTICTINQEHISAKISLKKATLMEEMEYYDVDKVLAQYKDVVSKHYMWEKGHFYLAKYYEKLMSVVDKESKERKKPWKNEFIKFLIKHYGTSLQYGNKFIYQSMPKLLTLWLDYGQSAHQICEDTNGEFKASDKSNMKEKMNVLNEDMTRLSKELPAYKFLTAVSQLVSRICHPNHSVWILLKEILCKIFFSYKQQAMWSIVAVSKSTVTMRSDRCKEILRDISRQKSDLKFFISHSLELTDMLLNICNHRCGNKDLKLSMKKDFPTLVKMLKGSSMSNIMVPLQETLTVKISTNAESQFNPFPDDLPYICGVDDCVDVLPSLQKPKKIKVKATNGVTYALMCKPKDDLRKDGRLMEFNSLVNKLLLQDPDCRRRQLHIRTYAVIPLNEECGLLEWVQNTSGLRNILYKIYKEKGCMVKMNELRQLYDTMKNYNVHRKVEFFKSRILPRFPPLFHEWFLDMFPTPTKWYMARVAYSRTSAVISMVGYILGLGDRHGENILFDSTCGDCVHVDFNCLFNKGEKFDCPERVPFRLTHNMIKAMGALGYEGVFRKSCEHTMKVMRNEKDSLLSVLNTFLYDPLVEWKKDSRGRVSSNEKSNDMAVKILRNVENRLKGLMSNHSSIRLSISIEGQVDQLIKQATSLDNLVPMYIGWAPYL